MHRNITFTVIGVVAVTAAWLMQSGRQVEEGGEIAIPAAIEAEQPRVQPLPRLTETASEAQSAPWIEADPTVFTGLPRPWEQAPNARQLTLNRQQITDADAGTQLPLFIPQLSTIFQGRVEHVTRRPSGNLSVRGHINGDVRFGFVITLGRESTFATIGTPQGLFNLAGNTQLAWIVAQRELDRQLDPSKPDFVVSQAEPVPP